MKIPPFKAPESWGKKSKVSNLVNKDKVVVGIKVEAPTETFRIPVIQPKDAAAFEKQNPQPSKFIKPSYSLLGYSYNTSRK